MNRIITMILVLAWVFACESSRDSSSTDRSLVSTNTADPKAEHSAETPPPSEQLSQTPATSNLATSNLSSRVPSWPSTETQRASQLLTISIDGHTEQEPRITPTTSNDEGQVELAPDYWDPSAFVRPLRRMRISQLRLAIADATGTAGWRDQWGQDLWTPLASTLGLPDWLLRVTEDRRPNTTFNKFLRDAAVDVCLPLIHNEMDPNIVQPEDRVFLVHTAPAVAPADDQATRDNLVYLLLRFHGLRIDTNSTEVDRWILTLNTVMGNTGSIAQSWQAVCVALIIHPRFYTY